MHATQDATPRPRRLFFAKRCPYDGELCARGDCRDNCGLLRALGREHEAQHPPRAGILSRAARALKQLRALAQRIPR